MEDEAAVAPFRWTSVGDRRAVDREIAGLRGAEKRRDLGLCEGGLIGRSGLVGRKRQRDPTAPRQCRLGRSAPRIGESVIRQLFHQNKGIKHRANAACGQGLDRLHHGLVGGRAAVNGAVIGIRDKASGGAVGPAHLPRHVDRIGAKRLCPWTDTTGHAAQIIAEPRHDERAGREVRGLIRQGIERHLNIRLARRRMDVERPIGPQPVVHRHGRCGQRVFPRSRDEGHATDLLRDVVGAGFHHLERELRDAVAEQAKGQVFDHHIGGAAIGGRVACALDRFDFRIGELVLAAFINPQGQVIGGDLYAVSPNAPNAGDWPLADRDGEADGIGVIRHAWLTGPFAAAACGGRALKEPRGPNDLPPHTHLPVDLRDGRALRRAG